MIEINPNNWKKNLYYLLILSFNILSFKSFNREKTKKKQR